MVLIVVSNNLKKTPCVYQPNSYFKFISLAYDCSSTFSIFVLSFIDLGLEGEHQLLNASLALQLCRTWLLRTQDKDKTLAGWIPFI